MPDSNQAEPTRKYSFSFQFGSNPKPVQTMSNSLIRSSSGVGQKRGSFFEKGPSFSFVFLWFGRSWWKRVECESSLCANCGKGASPVQLPFACYTKKKCIGSFRVRGMLGGMWALVSLHLLFFSNENKKIFSFEFNKNIKKIKFLKNKKSSLPLKNRFKKFQKIAL